MLGVVPESDAWSVGSYMTAACPSRLRLHQDGEDAVKSGLPEQELSVQDICHVNNGCV